MRTQQADEERRSKLRILGHFPAKVRGIDGRGEAFETNTVLDNLSASGLFCHLIPRVDQGARVFTLIQLPIAPNEMTATSRLAVRGVVLRVEPHLSGAWGTAVVFTSHRFL